MIDPFHPCPGLPVANSTANAMGAVTDRTSTFPLPQQGQSAQTEGVPEPAASDPVLCGHCGRTAVNGISCQGMCVADSGY